MVDNQSVTGQWQAHCNRSRTYTPADTTHAECSTGNSTAGSAASNRRRNFKCRRRVNSTNPRHTRAVRRWRISRCQSWFERL